MILVYYSQLDTQVSQGQHVILCLVHHEHYIIALIKDLSSDVSIIQLHKKWSFPLRISSVNVTKSAGNFGFGHIYWKNP